MRNAIGALGVLLALLLAAPAGAEEPLWKIEAQAHLWRSKENRELWPRMIPISGSSAQVRGACNTEPSTSSAAASWTVLYGCEGCEVEEETDTSTWTSPTMTISNVPMGLTKLQLTCEHSECACTAKDRVWILRGVP